jgi:transposase
MVGSREDVAHDVVRLWGEGVSARAIARSLRIARKTVKKMLVSHEKDRREGHLALPEPATRVQRPSLLDAYRSEVDRLLTTFPDITAQRVFEELRGAGFSGSYTVVKELVRRVRPQKRPEPSRKTPVFGPGEMAECDFSPITVDLGGTAKTLQFFSYVLCYSRRKRFSFFDRADLHAVMDGHVAAFRALDGMAAEVRYDNQKPVVLKWEGAQPLYNPRFIDFATYYEFCPRACRPGHPNDKPKVERSFWELQKSFFNGRRFSDENDLSRQLAEWMTGTSDQRLHRKTRRVVREMYEEEHEHLRPLPTHPYDTARVVYRLCDIEGFVSWEGNRYSVPYEHVTDILPMRATQTELFVYGPDLALLARHERRPKGMHQDAELAGHHPCGQKGTDLEQLEKTFQQMGPGAAQFFEGLKAQRSRSAAYHARQVLQLRHRFTTEDLLTALAYALSFGAFENTSVERILTARSAPRRLPEYVNERLLETLGEKPVEYDLTVYDEIPRKGDPESE